MRVAELIIASCILAVSGPSVASAQWVEPFKVLEEAKRDRLELDKRLARDAAARREQKKADQAAQANAERKLDDGRTSAAASAPTLNTPSTQFEPAREAIPETPVSHALPATVASGDRDSEQAEPPSARESVAGTALSTDTANGVPLFHQTAARGFQEVVSGARSSPAPAPGDENATSNQSLAPSSLGPIAATPAEPPTRVLITIDKAAQRMRVTVNGELRHTWPVSTGRVRFETPTGTFRPLRLAKVHYSKEWDHAPMPHSIFFTDRGHAIHGSSATRWLGRRASHGCVRLAPSQAAVLFALVQAEGPSATKVTITNDVSAGELRRPSGVEARARKLIRVRRASSDPGQIGRSDGAGQDSVW